MRGLSPHVLEIDIAGAGRMLAHWHDGALYLLALGSKEIVPHYQQTGDVYDEIGRCRPLPDRIAALTEVGFFTFDVEEEWRDFACEADPAWLTFLDAQQAGAASMILSRASKREGPQSWHFALLVGGPGTGKTSVLLSLFTRAWECDLVPQVVIEDQVADYVKKAAGIDLEPYRVTLSAADHMSHGGILLVDDPFFASEIKRARWLAQRRQFRSVVVAVDPLQLTGEFDDTGLTKLLQGSGSELVQLKSCYRQKRVVGNATKRALDAVAASSRYFVPAKKKAFAESRIRITELANVMEFPNPAGRFKVYSNPTTDDVTREVERLLCARSLWQHWTPYLLAWDDEGLGTIPRHWKRILSELPNARTLRLSDALEIKGVEFQHAVIVLSERLFLQLEKGFEGAGPRGYEARQLLRIPISRAKDSVTVLVHGQTAA